jgi:LytS/YehU family sensor histidine kinase
VRSGKRIGIGLLRVLPFFLFGAANVLVCYQLFGDGFILESCELMLSFLLTYLVFQNSKLHKEKKFLQLHTENLLMAKDHAESEVLKLQLHPHFLFNSLNTLHHLIQPGNAEARKYVQLLADVYRYILKNRTKELVLLQEELTFSQQYFYLLSIRYGQAIRLKMQIDPPDADDYLVMPISVQILFENAIKHNRFSVEEPLELFVTMDADFISVRNGVRRPITSTH